MALNQAQLDGAAARKVVLARFPKATSTFIGTYQAEVYIPSSGRILGDAVSAEDVVEHAWIAAAALMKRIGAD